MINKAEAIKLLKQDGYYLSYDRSFMTYHVAGNGICERVRKDTGRELSAKMDEDSGARYLMFRKYYWRKV